MNDLPERQPLSRSPLYEGRCPYPALYQYPWAGQIMRCCQRHASAMATLAQAIGASMHMETLDVPSACTHPDDLDRENA